MCPTLVHDHPGRRELPPQRRTHRFRKPGPNAALSLHGSFENLTAWLGSDSAIFTEEDDAFGYRRIARRIAFRLVAERPPAQAVVGRLGAGKTSLRSLVGAALKARGADARHVHIVAVELWPYETPRAAVEGVVRALVSALSREVSVLALRGLPEAYAEAMSSAGGVWSALAHLQVSPTSPFQALRRIDFIAAAIGQKYVVWVEDLERFAGRGGDSGQETPEEAERLNPIRALLYGLDQLQSVTVITATTSLHVRFDLEKIARFVEKLPELQEEDVARIVATFRNGCRNKSVIDLADPSVRETLDQLNDLQRLGHAAGIEAQIQRALLGDRIRSVADAIAALCSAPRTLKQALRAALETCERFAGEIDFDDVLVMSILREAHPDIFALVRQNVGALRGSRIVGEERRKVREDWEAALRAIVLDDRTRQAVEEIIGFVFPERGGELKPQGFQRRGRVDYFERFLSGSILPGVERDQEILRILLAEDDGAIIDLLEHDARSSAVEAFARLLSVERLLGLLVPLIKRRCAERSSQWREGTPPGMIPLWRIWLRRSERGELEAPVVLQRLRQALAEAVPQNLFLAVRLEQYFVIRWSGA